MSRLRVAGSALALLIACAMLVPAAANAQMMDGEKNGNVSVSFLQTSMDGFGFLNGVFTLGYTRKMSNGMTLEFYLPFAMASHDVLDNESGLGNPYLGVTMDREGSDMSLYGGLTLPLAPDDKGLAMLVGGAADMTAIGWFMPKFLGVHAGASWMQMNEGGLSPFWGVGPSLLIDTGDQGGDSTEIFVSFWGGAFMPLGGVSVGAGLSGAYWLTQGDLTGDALHYQLIIGAQKPMGGFTPGLTIRLPLSGDWGDLVSTIIGINVGIPIP